MSLFFFSSRRRHTRFDCDWSSDVCSSDLTAFVANDSGPMHMARALGVPTLAIFGSTDPAMFDFAGHAMLFAGVECAPCSFFGRSRCPRGHFRCMLDLSEERAWEALAPLLRAGRRLPLSA